MPWLWITLGIAAFLGLSALVAPVFVCYRMMFTTPPRRHCKEGEYDLPDGEPYVPFHKDMMAWTDMIRAYPHKEYAITSFDGLTLRAKLYEYKPGAPIELMFHGYKGNAERDLSGGVERCFRLGHSALLIDHRGSGSSDGKHVTFGILEMRDCLAWVDFAAKEFGENANLILTGLSMGAATVMMAAGEPLPPQVKYVLADCGYTSPKEIIILVMRRCNLAPALYYTCARIATRLFIGFSLEDNSPIEAVAKATVPMIFIHGADDDHVPCSMSERLYEACTSEKKKLVLIPGARHGLAFPAGQDEYIHELQAFKKDCGFDF